MKYRYVLSGWVTPSHLSYLSFSILSKFSSHNVFDYIPNEPSEINEGYRRYYSTVLI